MLTECRFPGGTLLCRRVRAEDPRVTAYASPGLALSFLILVGFTLMLESFDVHVPKGYIYFAMFFSIAVESLNLLRNKKNPL